MSHKSINEYSLTTKTMTSSIMTIDKISRTSSNDSNRNLLAFNQTNVFHFKSHSSDESLFTSDQLFQTSNHEGFFLHKSNLLSPTSNQSIPNRTISLTKMISEIPINPTSTHQIDIPTQIKNHQDIQPMFNESLWKTKLSLKTLLSMANRDDAQAKKNPKPIDYHLFLSNKLKNNSILQYQDYIDSKFQANSHQTIVEQDYEENRKLHKRVLDTMSIRKTDEPLITSKTRKSRQRKYISLSNDSSKPFLLTYRAVPISAINRT